MDLRWIIVGLFFHLTCAWVPPGLNSHPRGPPEEQGSFLNGVFYDAGHPEHEKLGKGIEEQHDHKKEEVAEMILDGEHIKEDFGELYQEEDIKKLDIKEQLFLWFKAHDWDENDQMDGQELLKALSHDHNYHHPEEHEDDHHEIVDGVDQDQHTVAAERQRLRRTVKIVDKIIEDNDVDIDGLISFPEFYNAFRAGNMDGLKVKK